jgi:hypothetical protein
MKANIGKKMIEGNLFRQLQQLHFNGGMPNWIRLFLVRIVTAQCWLGSLKGHNKEVSGLQG